MDRDVWRGVGELWELWWSGKVGNSQKGDVIIESSNSSGPIEGRKNKNHLYLENPDLF